MTKEEKKDYEIYKKISKLEDYLKENLPNMKKEVENAITNLYRVLDI